MSASADDEVHRAWRATIGAGHDDAFAALVVRHREPHRRYHTLTHVMWVLRHVAELAATTPTSDDAVVRAAALYHDAVYDPTSRTNEADSARLAADVLGDIGWDEPRITQVVALIGATAHGTVPPPDTDPTMLDVLLDADLAILGAEPAVYDAYARGVREEYGHVDEGAWRAGRAAVLDHFLALPSIYRTEAMRAALGRRAIANLTAERRRLEP
jgi:predicted metal-dependent HD superfamily phosphohydrolase